MPGPSSDPPPYSASRAETSEPVLSHGQIFRRYTVLAVLDVASKAFGLAVTVMVARHFGAAGFGSISFAQQIATYGLMASTCGLDLYAVKQAVARPIDRGSIATTVILLRLGLSVVSYLILLAVAGLVPAFREVGALIALFGLTFFSGAVSLVWVSQATQRTHIFGLAHLAIQGLYLCLVYLGITMNAHGPSRLRWSAQRRWSRSAC